MSLSSLSFVLASPPHSASLAWRAASDASSAASSSARSAVLLPSLSSRSMSKICAESGIRKKTSAERCKRAERSGCAGGLSHVGQRVVVLLVDAEERLQLVRLVDLHLVQRRVLVAVVPLEEVVHVGVPLFVVLEEAGLALLALLAGGGQQERERDDGQQQSPSRGQHAARRRWGRSGGGGSVTRTAAQREDVREPTAPASFPDSGGAGRATRKPLRQRHPLGDVEWTRSLGRVFG